MWILLARDPRILDRDPIRPAAVDLMSSLSRPPLPWTDDSTPLFPLLK
jgi:hypothetical protein